MTPTPLNLPREIFAERDFVGRNKDLVIIIMGSRGREDKNLILGSPIIFNCGVSGWKKSERHLGNAKKFTTHEEIKAALTGTLKSVRTRGKES